MILMGEERESDVGGEKGWGVLLVGRRREKGMLVKRGKKEK